MAENAGSKRPILWYVHHHGGGHRRRALAVSRRLDRPVVFASSAPMPDATLLPADFPGEADSATANGRLHWAPLHHRGLLDRHRALLELVAEHDPVLAVVDVSAEVTLLLRVSGIPVVAVRLPGDRDDAPHRLAHDLAGTTVLPVPAGWGLDAAGATPVGLVSALAAGHTPTPAEGHILVLLGAGGSALTRRHCRALAALGRPVVVAGAGDGAGAGDAGVTWAGHVADPGALIAAASVVIGGAGLGTVADVSRVGRPFVCIPDDRPFGEQRATAEALRRHESAHVPSCVPQTATGWAAAVTAAETAGPLRADSGGAERFAALLEAAAS